jgi:phage FluMu gp28-like protein
VTGIVVKRTAADLHGFLASEEGFISAFCRQDGAPIALEAYQRAHLNNRARFRWITKSRQVGFSWLLSLEALARCHLRNNYTCVFVSYNLDESKERILTARQAFEELPPAYQKKLVVDSKSELAFESSSPGKPISRIISVPSKAPRGKKGDTVLDELAHYVNDRAVYSGSTALILRSQGQLTGCSTPLGRRGIFWEIATQEIRKYPHHTRQEVPWWLCRFFCHDVKRAAVEAAAMPTEERVATFGTPGLIEQFESLPLEDFEQEFERRFVDESYSYFPYDLILPNTSDDCVLAADPTDMPPPQGRIVAGFDVGRTRDRSELAVFEQLGERYLCRLLRSYNGVAFEEQVGDLRRLLNTVPVARLSIDQTGIGMHLAELLACEYPQVEPVWFTNEAKEIWCTDFKIALQRHDVSLPRDRELVAQIHSIKRRVLPSGKIGFDAERTGQAGHADRFWAVALACKRERGPEPRKATEIGVRVIG